MFLRLKNEKIKMEVKEIYRKKTGEKYEKSINVISTIFNVCYI